MLKHLNSHALLEVRPKLYCSTLCVHGSASVGNRVIPLDSKSFFFHHHFDDDRTGNDRQIMPLF